MRPAKTTVTSASRVEVRVPTAAGFERVGQRRGESVSVCLVGLEPQQRPLRWLLPDAGVDALELPDDKRHTVNHCTESKALSNDRTAELARSLPHVTLGAGVTCPTAPGDCGQVGWSSDHKEDQL